MKKTLREKEPKPSFENNWKIREFLSEDALRRTSNKVNV